MHSPDPAALQPVATPKVRGRTPLSRSRDPARDGSPPGSLSWGCHILEPLDPALGTDWVTTWKQVPETPTH